MTTENSLIGYDGAYVSASQRNISYKVELEDGEYIFYIKKDTVQEIAIQSNEDEPLIAIILAYLEYARKSRNTGNSSRTRRIEEEQVISSISALLKVYAAEMLITIFRALKWHEMYQVICSENPNQELEEII